MMNMMTYPAGMMKMVNDDGVWSEKSVKNKGGQTMAKYLLEDNWYIVKDNYSWNLAKRLKNPKKNNEWDYNSMTYHATPEQAIAFYLKNRRSEALGSVESGTIEDILNIITDENKRLLFTLSLRFNEILKKDRENN